MLYLQNANNIQVRQQSEDWKSGFKVDVTYVYSIILQHLKISEAVCNLQLCIVSLGNLEEHCVCVKRCSGLEHFNNSI